MKVGVDALTATYGTIFEYGSTSTTLCEFMVLYCLFAISFNNNFILEQTSPQVCPLIITTRPSESSSRTRSNFVTLVGTDSSYHLTKLFRLQPKLGTESRL